jgi:hypothetical protein
MRITIIMMGRQPVIQNKIYYTATNPGPRLCQHHILRAVAQLPYSLSKTFLIPAAEVAQTGQSTYLPFSFKYFRI